jgi:hypothetical protein
MATYPSEYREPWVDDCGFLRFQTGDERRTREIVEYSFRLAADLTADGKRPLIVDARAMTSAEPGAWRAITERLTSVASALAIMVGDTTPTSITGWPQLFDSLLLPCQVFGDEESAVAWLRTLDI